MSIEVDGLNNRLLFGDGTTQSTAGVSNKGAAFRADKATSQAISAGTQTTVVFENVIYDLTGSYSGTTGKFTASVSGIYHFGCTLRVSPKVGSTLYFNFVVNGTSKDTSLIQEYAADSVQGNTELRLNAGDAVEVKLTTDVNVNVTPAGGNIPERFYGHLVRTL